jgi:hypothetical protein
VKQITFHESGSLSSFPDVVDINKPLDNPGIMTHVYIESGAILVPNTYRAITISIDYTNLYSGNRH